VVPRLSSPSPCTIHLLCSWSQTASPSQSASQAPSATQTPTWFTLTPSPSYVLSTADLAANAIRCVWPLPIVESFEAP
jgi:hypothetical protein